MNVKIKGVMPGQKGRRKSSMAEYQIMKVNQDPGLRDLIDVQRSEVQLISMPLYKRNSNVKPMSMSVYKRNSNFLTNIYVSI